MPQPSTDGVGLAHFRRSLGRTDWRSLAGMSAFIMVLHVLGFGILFGLVAPRHYHIGGDPLSSPSESAYSPTPSDCGTPSTPITSPLSTTPPASSSRTKPAPPLAPASP